MSTMSDTPSSMQAAAVAPATAVGISETSKLATKDTVTTLQKLYEIECSDNLELYRRAHFLITTIVVLATAVVALLRTSGVYDQWPARAAVFATGAASVALLAIAVSSVFLAMAAIPKDWDYPDADKLSNEDARVVVAELKHCVEGARGVNSGRFSHLQKAVICLFIALFAAAFEAAVIGAWCMC